MHANTHTQPHTCMGYHCADWKVVGSKQHSSEHRGIANYIAPETLHCGVATKEADVFSFGMLLHEVGEVCCGCFVCAHACVCVCVHTCACACACFGMEERSHEVGESNS